MAVQAALPCSQRAKGRPADLGGLRRLANQKSQGVAGCLRALAQRRQSGTLAGHKAVLLRQFKRCAGAKRRPLLHRCADPLGIGEIALGNHQSVLRCALLQPCVDHGSLG